MLKLNYSVCESRKIDRAYRLEYLVIKLNLMNEISMNNIFITNSSKQIQNNNSPGKSEYCPDEIDEQSPGSAKRKNKKFQKQIKEICTSYESYVYALLGKEQLSNGKPLIFNVGCKPITDQLVPDAILSFPNPDHPECQIEQSDQPIEVFEMIQQAIQFQRNNLQDQILLKALESVMSKLKPLKRKKRSAKQKTHQPLNQGQLRMRGIGTTFRMDKQSSLIMINNNISDLQLNEAEYMVNSFAQDLTNYDIYQQNNQYIQEKLNLDYAKLKQIKKKVMTGGGYFKKTEDDQWVRTKRDTKDTLTLMRNLILIILGQNGYHVRSFMSENGKVIYCQIFTDENQLKDIAGRMKLQKQCNLQFTDILSLEPVDNRFRPLRLNNRIWKPQEYKDLSEMFLYLRPQIIHLIQSINFKRIARETNQSFMNPKLFQYGQNDFYEDNENPTDEVWETFHQYLVHLDNSIRTIREEYRLDSDIASILNDELSPFDMYVRRNKSIKFNSLSKQNIYEPENIFHLKEVQYIENQVQSIKDKYKQFMILAGIPTTKYIRILQKEQQAYHYMLKFQEALKVANQGKLLLKNIWDILKIEPANSFGAFNLLQKNATQSQKSKYYQIWTKYQITENQNISLFSTSEKLKILQFQLGNLIDFNSLINKQFVTQFFSLHDNYELLGHCNNLYNIILATPEYYQKKVFSLKDNCQFSIGNLGQIKYDLLTKYFGEKIGLYYYFCNYLIKMLLPIAILGLVFNLIQVIIWDDENTGYVIITMTFAFVQTQWDAVFTDSWESKQLLFNLSYGQSSSTEKSIQRSTFKGTNKRSIENDQMNSLEIDYKELYKRVFIASIIMVLMIGAYSGVVIGLFVASMSLKEDYGGQLDTKVPALSVEVTVAATANVIILLAIDQVYDFIATALTNFENQRTVDVYETSFIIKKFILYYFAYVAPLLFIGFLNQPLKLYCYQNNCQKHVQYHFSTIFLLILFYKIGQALYTIYKSKNTITYSYSMELPSDVQKFIQEQGSRAQFCISTERYGILEAYLDYFILITMLTLFGHTFPMSYFLFMIFVIVKSYSQQYLLIRYYQRPWPQNVNSIGIWESVQLITSLISLLSNSGVITVYYSRKYGKELIFVFVFVIILNCSIKLLIESSFRDPPYQFLELIQRHQYVMKSTLFQIMGNLQGKRQGQSRSLKRFPIHKIFGVRNKAQIGHFETLSSQGELEDYFREVEIKTQLNQTQKSTKKRIESENSILEDPFKESIKKVIANPSDDLVSIHYGNRVSNWALRIRAKCKNVKKESRIKLQVYKLFYQIELLSTYRSLWTEERLTARNYYLRRKQLLLKNIDGRKYIMYRQNLRQMKQVAQDKAENKYKKHFKQLRFDSIEDQHEYDQLIIKQEKFINKQTWMNSRKVIVTKVKAVWLNGFRKIVQKQSSLKIMQEYYKRTSFLQKIERDSTIYQQFESLVNYSKLKDYTLEKFIEIFSQIKADQKPTLAIKLSNQYPNLLNYYVESFKSPTYQAIIDKFSDTFIFNKIQQKFEEIIMDFFQDEQIPIPKIFLLKLITKTVWIAQDQDKKQCLFQFLQIKKGQFIQFRNSIDSKLGVKYLKPIVHGRLSNIVDQIDDFYIKGYCACVYQIDVELSLRSVIRYRNTYGQPYTIPELNSFIYANLELFKIRSHGNITIDHYFVYQREYVIIESQIQTESDIFNLGIVVLQMILLRAITDPQKEYEQLDHPLKRVIYEMLYEDPSIEELQKLVHKQPKFFEMDISFEQRKDRFLNLNLSFGDYLQLTLHKLNVYYRIKQYAQAEAVIEQFENVYSAQIQKSQLSAIVLFMEDLTKNLNYYLLDTKRIKQNLSILLVFYIKHAIYFEQRKLYQLNVKLVVNSIKKIIKSIQIIQKQIVLNINFDNLSEQQQLILLHHRNDSNGEEGMNNQRNYLLKALRKHKSNLQAVYFYQKQMMRYQNQFTILTVLKFYFNNDYSIAISSMEEILFRQQQLIGKIELPEINDNNNGDFDFNLINFNQYSPDQSVDESEIIEQQQEEPIHPNLIELINETPSFSNQYVFYKFLQLIIWFDSGNEQFYNQMEEFLNMQLDNPTFFYYQQQLIALTQGTLSIKYTSDENDCFLGKYIVIDLNKWFVNIPQTLIQSTDVKFFWRQMLIYQTIQRSFVHRAMLTEYLKQELPIQPQASILLKIKIIHQVLHLDGNSGLTQFYTTQIQDFSNLKTEYFKSSLIYTLQDLHQEISIESNSWFHHKGMISLKTFYLLSIAFAYSKKLFENYQVQNKSLLELCNYAMSLLMVESKQFPDVLKNGQIQQGMQQKLLLDSNCDKTTLYQSLNSYYYIFQSKGFQIQQFYNEIEKRQLTDLQSSILVMIFIQFYISCHEFELADVMISFCKKLVGSNAIIFKNKHDGFLEDLDIMQLQVNRESIDILYPFNLLYKRNPNFKYFDNLQFYAQLVIYNLFYGIDYEYNLDHSQTFCGSLQNISECKDLYVIYLYYQLLMLGVVGKNFDNVYDKIQSLVIPQNSLLELMISHLMCRFYINQNDFELALPYSSKILSFIYSIQARSNIIINQTKKKKSYYNNIDRDVIHKLADLSYIEINNQQQDYLYLHLYDDMFIQEVILNHLEIQINLQDNMPSIQLIFQVLENVQDEFQSTYLLYLIALYFRTVSTDEGIKILSNQLVTDYQTKITQIENEKKKLKKKQYTLGVLKQLTAVEADKIKNRINILNYQLNIYQSFQNGLDTQLVLSWSTSAAEKAIYMFQMMFFKETKKKYCHFAAKLYILISENYLTLQQITKSKQYMNLAENEIARIYERRRHPNQALLFYKQAFLKRELYQQAIEMIKQIIDLNEFKLEEIIYLTQELILQNAQLIAIFDQYQYSKSPSQLKTQLRSLVNYAGLQLKQEQGYILKDDAQLILNQQLFRISSEIYNGLQELLEAQAIYEDFRSHNQFSSACQELLCIIQEERK